MRKHKLLISGMKEEIWLQILQTLKTRIGNIMNNYEQFQVNVFGNVDQKNPFKNIIYSKWLKKK